MHYEGKSKVLVLEFETGRTLRYSNVPDWVPKKLLTSPSPRTLWEDHIRDEYSAQESKTSSANPGALEALQDLFKA